MSTRKALATLVAFVALAGLVLVNVGGASGLHVDGEDFELSLHLDTDGHYFEHEGAFQHLGIGQCLVTGGDEGPFVTLSASNNKLGVAFDSLGVRSKGPGRSCGRVSGSESFTIEINNGTAQTLEGLNFDRMELDIEAKQDAVVIATTYLGDSDGEIFTLRTGGSATGEPDGTPHSATSTSGAGATADCLQGVSDSGADSGANDNCRWTIDPAAPFDTVVFSSGGGEFGLEGGEDTGSDSLFILTDLGVLDCGETVETGDAAGLGDPYVVITRGDQPGTEECLLKEYFLTSSDEAGEVVDGSQSFTFAPSGQANASFVMTVKWVPEPALNPLPVTFMDFNGDGDATDPTEVGGLKWCVVDGSGNPDFPVVEFPAGTYLQVPWCLVAQRSTLLGTGMVQLEEDLLGTGDPSGWR